jgi:hypothetical protein
MAYINLQSTTFGKLSDAPGFSFFRAASAGGEQFLVGDTHVIQVSGERAGTAIQKNQADRRIGFIHTEIELEVQSTSMFEPAHVQQPVGALIVTEVGVEVLGVASNAHGWRGLTHFVVVGKQRTEHAIKEVGYSSWRIVRSRGNDREVLTEYTSAEMGDVDD